MRSLLSRLMGNSTEELLDENRILRERHFLQSEYIRNKTNQLLMLMGTLPARPEEFDDQALIEVDPIGTVCDALVQILEHEKELKEGLRQAHEKTQAILSSVGVGILVVDRAMKIQMFNQKLLDLFLLDGKTLAGQTCCQALCGSSSTPANCTFQHIMETRRPYRQVDWIRKENHFEVAGTPVKDRFGEISSIVLAYTDITERVDTLSRLREREQMYREVFENCSDLVQCVQPDGTLLFVNRTWRETLGYSGEAMGGMKIWNVIAPDHRKACLELFDSLMRGQRLGEINTVFFTKTGEEVPVTGHVSFSFHNGKPLASLGMFRPAEAVIREED